MKTTHIQVKASAGAKASPWVRPADWIDISSVGNNEINLLVSDGLAVAFTVSTEDENSYSIDWGDGIIENDCEFDVVQQHTYSVNGTPCSLGYNTWKIRIFGSSSNIVGFSFARHSFINRSQTPTVLDIVFGTNYLSQLILNDGTSPDISLRNLKSCSLPQFLSPINLSGLFNSANNLEQVNLPSSFGAATSAANMFQACKSLSYLELPATWGNITSVANMFYYCSSLSEITLPESWGSVTTTANMFDSCTALYKVILPSAWGESLSSLANMFKGCTVLKTVNLPVSWASSITNVSYMFYSCLNLDSVSVPSSWFNINNISNMFYATGIKKITLPSSWGSVTNVSNAFSSCQCLIDITLPASFGPITDASGMFGYCYQLKQINNLEYLGSTSVQTNLSSIISDCVGLTQAYSTNSLINKLLINGVSGYPLKISSIRLTNAGSLFAGATPQINVSYTDLNAAALNLLFGDLPTLTGKTINITGCPGAATCTRSIATAKGWTVTG